VRQDLVAVRAEQEASGGPEGRAPLAQQERRAALEVQAELVQLGSRVRLARVVELVVWGAQAGLGGQDRRVELEGLEGLVRQG